MKRISMLKFRKICEEISPAEFSFSIRNQPVREFNSVELTSTYPKMSMMFNPNRICFRNEAGTICFNRVKAINYYEESQAFGMVLGLSATMILRMVVRSPTRSLSIKNARCKP